VIFCAGRRNLTPVIPQTPYLVWGFRRLLRRRHAGDRHRGGQRSGRLPWSTVRHAVHRMRRRPYPRAFVGPVSTPNSGWVGHERRLGPTLRRQVDPRQRTPLAARMALAQALGRDGPKPSGRLSRCRAGDIPGHHAAAFIDSGNRILTTMPWSTPSLTASTIP
jgi:hypothetical protein